ncbi:hypothetical protein AQUCO_01600417v1 [Aquilegia coerulea]|uniref:Uncharacterized protein n=1 Tax=Aquilegia coerulea TaxID=218851 RepID=A0A2G5DRJ9_AQUCA|nr:hypothetical protein AQUCO_01600417v1 [Aquilegia coerulea]
MAKLPFTCKTHVACLSTQIVKIRSDGRYESTLHVLLLKIQFLCNSSSSPSSFDSKIFLSITQGKIT